MVLNGGVLPDSKRASALWIMGGTLHTFIWDQKEGGEVTLRTGERALIEPGDYVTYMATGAGISFVSVLTPAELVALRGVTVEKSPS